MQNWHLNGKTFPNKNDDKIAEDTSEKPTKIHEKVRDAYNSKFGEVALALVVELYGEVPVMVKLASANIDELKIADIIHHENFLVGAYNFGKGEVGAEQFIETCVHKFPSDDPNFLQEAKDFFKPSVMKACKKSFDAFKKHILPTSDVYSMRAKFDVMLDKESPTHGEIGSQPLRGSSFFFGKNDQSFSSSAYGIKIEVDYEMFLEEFKVKKTRIQAMGNDAYWKSKRATMPLLAATANRWLLWPTSSIAAERTFAIGRWTDASLRSSQRFETFQRELKFKVNKDYLTDALMQSITDYTDSRQSLLLAELRSDASKATRDRFAPIYPLNSPIGTSYQSSAITSITLDDDDVEI